MVLSSYVGATVRRKEDPRLITGSSTYVDALTLPGLVSVAFVRSPYAHATINSIDGSAALAVPGVHAVITAAELKQVLSHYAQESTGGETGEDANEESAEDAGIPVPPVLPLADVKVRYVGEAVAAVVADTAQIAEDAAALVEVDWDVLEAVIDPYAAKEPGAPQLYDEVPNNISVIEETVHGDVDAALGSAAIRVKAKIRAPRCHPMPMEPRGIVASPDAMTQGLTVWTSTQAPHWNRNDIAGALGLSQSQVRAIAPEVGGGFGVKIGSYQEDLIVAAMAHKLKRPVKWMETRSENFLATHHGRDQWADVEIAADADGRLRGLRVNVLQDLGAYPKATDLPELTGKMAAGCYEIPALEFHAVGVYTNTMAVGAYRGAGRPEAAYYIERAMDLVADAGGFDPVEVRRKNFIPPDQFPYNTPS